MDTQREQTFAAMAQFVFERTPHYPCGQRRDATMFTGQRACAVILLPDRQTGNRFSMTQSTALTDSRSGGAAELPRSMSRRR
jgi:hypothetical protein